MKTKTFLVGLFILISAVMFGMQIWGFLEAIFPTLQNAEWLYMDIPVINSPIKDFVRAFFISILAIIGSKITRTAIFK